jgi:hypothetical protein
MSSQKEINTKMRAILVDWIVEVHMKFKLVPPTLYLAVQLIDRYGPPFPPLALPFCLPPFFSFHHPYSLLFA